MLPGVNHALLAHAEPEPRTLAQAPHDVALALLTCLRAWLKERLGP